MNRGAMDERGQSAASGLAATASPASLATRFLVGCLLTMLVALLPQLAQAQSLAPAKFQAPLVYNGSLGTVPNAVAMGDFNGDGLLDFAVVEINPSVATEGQVEIFLGHGDGSFVSSGTIPIGTIGGQQVATTHTIGVGHFNGPSLPLGIAVAVNQAVGCAQGGVVVLFGKGDGSFQSPVCLPDAPGVNSVAVADFDGTGFDGIAAANASGAGVSVTVFQSNGMSSFPTSPSFAIVAPGTSTVMNGTIYEARYGNGTHPNLVLLAKTGLFSQFMAAMQTSYTAATNTLSFASVSTLSTGSNGFTDVGFADMNGDGIEDIVGLSQDSNLQYFPVTVAAGTGLNQVGALTGIGGPIGLELSIGDFNGNGIADFAVLGGNENLSIGLDVPCFNTLNPLCKMVPNIEPLTVGPFGPAGQGLASGFSVGLNEWVIVDSGVFQVTNSSFQEIPEARTIAVYLLNPTTGQPTLAPLFGQSISLTENNSPAAFAVADLDGDGAPDVAVLGEDESSFAATVTPFQNVYMTNNATGFVAKPDFDLGGGAGLSEPGLNGFAIVAGKFRTTNLSGGLPDLALVLQDGIALLDNGGAFTFKAEPNCQGVSSPATNCYLGGNPNFPGFAFSSPSRPAIIAADVNGDGIDDIVLAVPENCNASNSGGVKAAIFVLISNGDGSFQSPVFYPSPVVNPVGLAAGKLLGNSVPDLVVVNGGEVCTGSEAATGSITDVGAALLPNNGSGVFSTEKTIFPQSSDLAVPDVSAVAVGDMNADGAPDVVISAFDGIHVLLNTPGSLGNFNDPAAVPLYGPADTIMNASQIDLGDFNGDGTLDVVAAVDGVVYMFPGDGAGGLAAPIQGFASGSNSGQLKAIDVNGDGSPDVLVSNSQGFSVVLNGNTVAHNPIQTTALIAITPSTAAVALGAPVSIIATVITTSGNVGSTGTVTFFDSYNGGPNQSQGSPSSLINGTASIVLTNLAVGQHNFSFAYNDSTGSFENNVSAFLPLLVLPNISSVTLSPASVIGGAGGTATGTVTLNGSAPTGGLTISLSSNSPAAIVPASITVPAEASSQAFQITTTAVTAITDATIAASYAVGSATGAASGTFEVDPAATQGPVIITVNESITVNDADTFPDIVETESITVMDSVTVIAVNPPINVAAPVAFFSPSTVGFGDQTGNQILQISNIGSGSSANLIISSLPAISGSGSSAFAISLPTCTTGATSFPIILPSDGACTFAISYTVPSSGAASATLTFADSAALTNCNVPLSCAATTSSPYTQAISLNGSGPSSTAPPPPAIVSVAVNETITVADVPTVSAGCGTIAISPSGALPTAVVGFPYSQAFTVSGGFGAPSWSLNGAPSWLSINSGSGFLSGTPPRMTSKPYNFTVTASFANTCSRSAAVSLSLVPPSIKIVAASSTPFTITTAPGLYFATVTIVNAGNVPVSTLNFTGATLGRAKATLFGPPAYFNLAPGATAIFTAQFPASAGNPGSAGNLAFSGNYSAGNVKGTWHFTFQGVILP